MIYGIPSQKKKEQLIKVIELLDLKSELNKKLNCRFESTEASSRNGETLSVRYAFWDIDLNALDELNLKWWKILELSLHTKIYGEFVQSNN